jgi:hypothetical protein
VIYWGNAKGALLAKTSSGFLPEETPFIKHNASFAGALGNACGSGFCKCTGANRNADQEKVEQRKREAAQAAKEQAKREGRA